MVFSRTLPRAESHRDPWWHGQTPATEWAEIGATQPRRAAGEICHDPIVENQWLLNMFIMKIVFFELGLTFENGCYLFFSHGFKQEHQFVLFGLGEVKQQNDVFPAIGDGQGGLVTRQLDG